MANKISIGVINPITTKEFAIGTKEEAKNLISEGTDIEVYTVKKGPASIECQYDEICAAPGIVEMMNKIEEKVDAVVINCFGDPGIEGIREMTNIPVVGPGSSSMLMASLLGDSFSIVTVLKRLEPAVKEVAYRAGVLSKLSSVRAVDLPVLDLEKDKNTLTSKIVEESINAIEKDNAKVIVLGCTGMAGLAKSVEKELKREKYYVPVIDPFAVAVKQAEVLAKLGLTQSKLTYPEPSIKDRIW